MLAEELRRLGRTFRKPGFLKDRRDLRVRGEALPARLVPVEDRPDPGPHRLDRERRAHPWTRAAFASQRPWLRTYSRTGRNPRFSPLPRPSVSSSVERVVCRAPYATSSRGESSGAGRVRPRACWCSDPCLQLRCSKRLSCDGSRSVPVGVRPNGDGRVLSLAVISRCGRGVHSSYLHSSSFRPDCTEAEPLRQVDAERDELCPYSHHLLPRREDHLVLVHGSRFQGGRHAQPRRRVVARYEHRCS